MLICDGTNKQQETIFKSPPPPRPPSQPQAQQSVANFRLASDGEPDTEVQSTSSSCLSSSLNISQQQPCTTTVPNQLPFTQSASQMAEPQPSTSSNITLTNPDKIALDSDSELKPSSLPTEGQHSKKRKKSVKKGAKLDVKLKLEKSRQSARECRARKKLRYQYLEDLVCNREKAVMILREELVKFCDIAKQLDAGSSITDSSLRLVKEQAKENNHLDN